SFLVLEASDDVGGRVRTDVVDGFRLDRGFQILLTAYPEARRHFDFLGLRLRKFTHGALIRCNDKFCRFADPRKDLFRGIGTLFNSVGRVSDKWKLMELENRVRCRNPEVLFEKPEGLTLDLLRWHGFSETMIDNFFRPLFGGVF